EVMMMLIPEAWEKNSEMSETKKAFYEFNSCLMEPWDGPASIPFTDGNYIGAVLDRNGLRPSRYTVTKNGYVIMSSETGVIEIEPKNIEHHGRLEPGKMFLVDMNQGRIINDEEIKEEIAARHPYQKWLDKNLVHLKDIPYNDCPVFFNEEKLNKRQVIFGYTQEDINTIILPMAQGGKEPIGSMGSDTPLAVLSERPQLIYNYFKQLFAQVTNPPLDGIREELITDISLTLGSDSNIFDINELHCKKLKIKNPVISKQDLDKIKSYQNQDFKATSFPILYEIKKGHNGLEEALTTLLNSIVKAIDDGTNIVILSDRNVNEEIAPIPALLACSFINSALRKLGKRSKLSLIIESAEPREVHHFALLFGYGASAINPYMVNEIIEEKINELDVSISSQEAVENFNKAVGKGILKVMNKIGISTLNSYRGSQLFECIGINTNVVDAYFPNTVTRIQGIGLHEIEKEISKRYFNAYKEQTIAGDLDLEVGGQYRWRRNGEKHMFNPLTIAKLQEAVRSNKHSSYKEYSELINNQTSQLMTIRGLFEFTNYDPISIDEVEPWTEIVKRFKTGAMSYGSISKEAHENLAVAMNRIGGKSNSGEGGEDEDRFYKDADGDWKNSAIKQVASGRFGVTSNYLTNASEIQIKMAQGAKPGEGGQLPGPKVNPSIAKTRNSTPYVGLISPPPH
ncbi:glutamate synthase central domain-containing protein, partial [Yeosuana sp.]|uniref:glutamate synthase central domain-containing protein n=1 Tax=Yeosuana sp. TaxID=2529388 RepID=UPI004054CA40